MARLFEPFSLSPLATFLVESEKLCYGNLVMKPWKSSTADSKFSLFIRERDGACVRCGKTSESARLECSHFFDRSNSATRYDPENCDTLCYPCHAGNAQGWEYHKQCCYKEWKRNQLGEEKFEELCKRGHSIYPRSKAITDCMELLK